MNACPGCLGETRRTTYLLGQAVAFATAAELVSSWAAQHAVGSDVAEILTQLVDRLSLAAEEKSFSLRVPMKISPNMPAVSE
jgi:hypothetical protein